LTNSIRLIYHIKQNVGNISGACTFSLGGRGVLGERVSKCQWEDTTPWRNTKCTENFCL